MIVYTMLAVCLNYTGYSPVGIRVELFSTSAACISYKNAYVKYLNSNKCKVTCESSEIK